MDCNCVAFIVELDDRTTHRIEVESRYLLAGDHDARLIAMKWQADRRIPARGIVSLRRARSDE